MPHEPHAKKWWIAPQCRKSPSRMNKSLPNPNVGASGRSVSSAESYQGISGLNVDAKHTRGCMTNTCSFLPARPGSKFKWNGTVWKTLPLKVRCRERLGPPGALQRIWYEGTLQQVKTEAEVWPQPWPLIENASLLVQPQADRHDLIQLSHSAHCMAGASSFFSPLPQGYKTFFYPPTIAKVHTPQPLTLNLFKLCLELGRAHKMGNGLRRPRTFLYPMSKAPYICSGIWGRGWWRVNQAQGQAS